MLQKNIDKQARKERKTWSGYYTRKTPTKQELIKRKEKKYKNKADTCSPIKSARA